MISNFYFDLPIIFPVSISDSIQPLKSESQVSSRLEENHGFAPWANIQNVFIPKVDDKIVFLKCWEFCKKKSHALCLLNTNNIQYLPMYNLPNW